MKRIITYIFIVVLMLSAAYGFWKYTAPDKSILNVSVTENKSLAEEQKEQLLKNIGPAPELIGITKWINGDPITLESLRGKVILVNFWTYSCISCIRSLPYINKWSVDYQDRGFAVVSIHTPEFNFEKIPANVEAAVKRYKIPYPVALDNNYKTWNAFNNQFWPSTYLIDKDGDIVYSNLGEGNFDRTEKAIRTLVGLEGPFDVPPAPEVTLGLSPEIQLGLLKGKSFGGLEIPSSTEQIFAFPKKLADNKFALEGNWKFDQESAIHTKGFGRIKLTFNAAKVYLVAQSPEPTTIKVYIDGQLNKGVVISDSNLYQLSDLPTVGKHTMEIEIPETGFSAFNFTFGGAQ